MKRGALISLLLLALSCKARSEPLRVAAAADLGQAFAQLGPAFSAQSSTPTDLKLTIGSTGLLARQLLQGAPFDLFLAANVSYAEQAVKAGACDGQSLATYARGRLVIWVKGAGGAELTLSSLADARFQHIAIANPEHAPYGKAARDALSRAGIWGRVSERMVYGENVQQTFELAKSGNADVAIIGLSLAFGTVDGSWAVVDDALHEPIDQALVVCNNGTNRAGARRLKTFLEGPEGRAILRRFGFLLAGETLATAP
jgi:molybdate transport system substrate-binding protein